MTKGSYTMPRDRFVGIVSVTPGIDVARRAVSSAMTRKLSRRLSSSPNSTVKYRSPRARQTAARTSITGVLQRCVESVEEHQEDDQRERQRPHDVDGKTGGEPVEGKIHPSKPQGQA